ncbi:MAG: DNA methyltransferase [Chloroflexi bacterium]|nr:DNA methyltransferase [Chloroflexota bacterium]
MNKLYYGDCLTIMQDMPLGSVDLIYLDPPFNSNRTYNAIYKDETGNPLPDQIEAFCDAWELDEERERVIRAMPVLMREAGIDDSAARLWQLWMNALRNTQPRLLAYLSYMTERLIVMQRILKPTGSIYFHCDPTASHYIKVIMDAVFGHGNFRNEVIWGYRTGGVSKRWFGRKHDVILFYVKASKHATFHVEKEKSYNRDCKPYRFKGVKEYQDENGNWYTMATMRDIWEINAIGRTSKERLGYTTQKPIALLTRIIKASSNPGDLVLDPFAGCATTLEAAHRLERQWIGIDIAIHAVKRVAQVRLGDRCGLIEGRDYTVEGVPRNLEGAQDLWERDKYHFQKWAVEQIEGFVTTRRTNDGGIDGRLYFYLPNNLNIQSMVLEVKGGKNINVSIIRDLRGVLERDDALMAGLIIMAPLSAAKERNFNREMAQAGSIDVHGIHYPRMQILTVEEILEGKRFSTPNIAAGRHDAQPKLPIA